MALEGKFSNNFDFEVLSGGMITGRSVGPLSNMADFIRKAIPRVEEYTGIAFGKNFLENLQNPSILFSSLEPGNVLTVVKELAPGSAVSASHAIQSLIYHDGIHPTEYTAYLPLFEEFSIKPEMAFQLLQSAETSQKTVLEFSQIQKWQIQGFPAVLLETPDGKLHGISRGYLPQEEMEHRLRPFLLHS
jgi:putative protein-disulfide isomerase